MHIAFFSDQHPATLGGLQVSLGLQREQLEAAGHLVTICSPNARKKRSPQFCRPNDVVLRATPFGDHSFRLAEPIADRAIEAGFAALPPVDIVHVQADVWGAWNGYRFARRHGLPVVHTMHTNIEQSLPAMLPFPRALFQLMFVAQQHYMKTRVRNMADYVRAFAQSADELVVPTSHFADYLMGYGIGRSMHIIPTGVNDRLIERALARPKSLHPRPVFVWPGRVSEEKRLADVIRAFALSAVNAELHVYGSGPDRENCQLLTDELGIRSKVRFFGAVSHDQVVMAMRHADAVIQSSLGYETQGLTVYEAISVGTPVLVRDPAIAAELPAEWSEGVSDSSIESFAAGFRTLAEILETGRFSSLESAPTCFQQSNLSSRLIDLYQQMMVQPLAPLP